MRLSRSALELWVDAIADKLRPLYDELNGYFLHPGKVSTNDSQVNLLAPGQMQNQSSVGICP